MKLASNNKATGRRAAADRRCIAAALLLPWPMGVGAGSALSREAMQPDASQHMSQRAVDVVTDYVDAQGRLDTRRMRALMTDDYVEVSPLGEVDARDAVLGFFSDPELRPYKVRVSVDQEREWKDNAVVIAALTADIGGTERTLRTTFVLHRAGGLWRIASVHYTPVRPKG